MEETGLAAMLQKMKYLKTGIFKLLQKSILLSIFSLVFYNKYVPLG